MANQKNLLLKKYGIPRSTLQFRLGPKFSKTRPGPKKYLSKEEEDMLVTWVLESHRKGFPKRKIALQLSVKNFMDSNNRTNPFKDNMSGNTWYSSFLKRHPTLTSRTPEAVTAASSNVSEKYISKWFAEIEDYLKSKDTFEILQDPTRIYNGDETCFLFCPKLGKVIAPKGAKNVYEVDKGQAKQNLTVMLSFSASGAITPPMIIFPNKRLNTVVAQSIPDDWGIGMSENGWMKAEIFVDYIKNVFHKHLVKTNVTFPVILFVDGHRTHLTYQLSLLCSELNIVLIALYPNSTRILQPADVSSFKPLKTFWKQEIFELIGDGVLLEMETNNIRDQNHRADCEYFTILRNTYSDLQISKSASVTLPNEHLEQSVIEVNYVSDEFEFPFSEDEILEMPVVFEDSVQRENESKVHIIDNIILKEGTSIKDGVFEQSEQHQVCQGEIVDTKDLITNQDEIIEEKPTADNLEVIKNDNVHDEMNVIDIPKEPKAVNQRKENLSHYLQAVRIPERMGKRNTERMPYVITSYHRNPYEGEVEEE
ncbi:hypothetical protein NQ318_022884 [Aromia moschata]|uniref:HTH CENPB-type domain-containing protein n=1 Tax=Aromia moschata TaxID=1265417 RepID=A0AAV8XXJ4_9CUCU|nr:hypothetical protein NQ318_022884 [Aromia moschata]